LDKFLPETNTSPYPRKHRSYTKLFLIMAVSYMTKNCFGPTKLKEGFVK